MNIPKGLIGVLLMCFLPTGCALNEPSPQAECATSPCFGNRPSSENGCCLGLGGDTCGGDSHRQCDNELGYTCTQGEEDASQNCQGRYHLRDVDVQFNNLTIQWDDFKPENYRYEYSVLYTTAYHNNLTFWTRTEKGTDPQATIHNLRTSQLYFIRVAIWNDPFEQIYRNISETIIVKTKIGCIVNGQIYLVNETIEVECEDRCLCTETGDLQCEALTCNEGSCENGDTVYLHGQRFSTECKSCECQHGHISCFDKIECLVMEPSEECLRPVRVAVPDQCCPSWNCSTDCVFGETYYRHGDEWREGCDRVCSCDSGRTSCVSICQEPTIPDHCSVQIKRKDSRDCCDVIECQSSPDECVHDGRTHNRGDMFHTHDGCSVCACTANTTVMCSVAECPHVRILAPSEVCPEPDIQNTGCCRLHLCGPLPGMKGENDVLQASGVTVLSQSPVSFTVSFIPPRSSFLASNTRSYKLMYTEYTYHNVSTQWRETTFEKPSTQSRLETNTFLEPFFKGPGLVEDRIYMTVEGVFRNTTYIVKLFAVVYEVGEERNEINNALNVNQRLHPIYPPVAVLTMIGENMCLVRNNELIPHGVVYKPSCREKCICSKGEIICEDLCEKEATIVIPSRNCPNPRLENTEGHCCPQWKCYPEDGGCLHGELAMKTGETIREGCVRYCTCKNGNMTCVPVCGEVPTKPLRKNCRLDTLPNQCCPTWMCPPDKKPFEAFETKLKINFQGACKTTISSFKSAFAKSLIDAVHKSYGCPDDQKDYLHVCDPNNVETTCIKSTSRHRRSQGVTGLDAILTMSADLNGTGTYSRRKRDVLSVADSFAQWIEDHGFNVSVNDTVYISGGSVQITNTSFVCKEGYLKSNNLCVEATRIEKPVKPAVNITLSTVEISSHSFTVGWREISTTEAEILKTLYLEFRQFSVGATWNRSEEFSIHRTLCTIDHLQAAVSYNTRLVMIPSIQNINKLLTNPIVVTTEPLSEFEKFHWVVKITQIDVTSQSVRIDWNPPESTQCISAMELLYKVGTNEDRINVALDPMKGRYLLENLSSSTYYVMNIETLLRNGTVLKSGTVHTTTKNEDDDHAESHKIIIIAISIVAAVALVLLIALSMLLWRRHCIKSKLMGMTVAFENKVFGVQLTEDRRSSIS